MVPDLETSDVELKAPPAKSQRDSFHQQLLLCEGHVAGIARLAIAWTAPNPSDPGMWQAPVLDLASDEKTERFLVHRGLAVRAAIPVVLELPCREATDVDVELVQSGVITIAGELNLELKLIFRDGLTAHRAGRTAAGSPPGRQLTMADLPRLPP